MWWPACAVGEWWIEAAVHDCIDMCLVCAGARVLRVAPGVGGLELAAACTAQWVRMLGIGCACDNGTRLSECYEYVQLRGLVMSEQRIVEFTTAQCRSWRGMWRGRRLLG